MKAVAGVSMRHHSHYSPLIHSGIVETDELDKRGLAWVSQQFDVAGDEAAAAANPTLPIISVPRDANKPIIVFAQRGRGEYTFEATENDCRQFGWHIDRLSTNFDSVTIRLPNTEETIKGIEEADGVFNWLRRVADTRP